MFDFNGFKRSVKEWIRDNPSGSEHDLRDYCDELIPPAQYTANSWIVDQTLSWYKHILENREHESLGEDDDVA